MIELDTPSRRTWYWAVAALLLLALAVPWAISRMSPPPPDDPRELLRRAGAQAAAVDARPTGKSIDVSGTTASGAPARARLHEVRDSSGRTGYGVHLPGDLNLKEGETATLSMPGGGNVVIGRPPGGVIIRGPQEGRAPEPPSGAGGSSPR